jgi:hypothetical protein
MPILFFGDLYGYRTSPTRYVTVGLNPSYQEFPEEAPWSRFPAATPPEGRTLGAYLESLSAYFVTDPYRRWFDRSFEPVLRGAGASYYPGGRLHGSPHRHRHASGDGTDMEPVDVSSAVAPRWGSGAVATVGRASGA